MVLETFEVESPDVGLDSDIVDPRDVPDVPHRDISDINMDDLDLGLSGRELAGDAARGIGRLGRRGYEGIKDIASRAYSALPSKADLQDYLSRGARSARAIGRKGLDLIGKRGTSSTDISNPLYQHPAYAADEEGVMNPDVPLPADNLDLPRGDMLPGRATRAKEALSSVGRRTGGFANKAKDGLSSVARRAASEVKNAYANMTQDQNMAAQMSPDEVSQKVSDPNFMNAANTLSQSVRSLAKKVNMVPRTQGWKRPATESKFTSSQRRLLIEDGVDVPPQEGPMTTATGSMPMATHNMEPTSYKRNFVFTNPVTGKKMGVSASSREEAEAKVARWAAKHAGGQPIQDITDSAGGHAGLPTAQDIDQDIQNIKQAADILHGAWTSAQRRSFLGRARQAVGL